MFIYVVDHTFTLRAVWVQSWEQILWILMMHDFILFFISMKKIYEITLR